MRCSLLLCLLPVAHARARVPPPRFFSAALSVRGGSDASLDDLEASVGGPTLGDLDKQQTPEAKRNEGMKKAAAMMRQMGGKGEAIDKLEAAAARGDASEAELIELYMLARREQAKALVDPAAGDHLAQALRMIACESEEHLDGGRLPSAAHERVMDAIAGDLEMSRADFEKELAAKSDENAGQILEVLRDEGFVAKVQARFTKLVPVIEEQVKKAKEAGAGEKEEAGGNAAMAEAMLSQMKAWKEDAAPLEKMRSELLEQLDKVKDDKKALNRLAQQLRPVVIQMLGAEPGAEPDEPDAEG